MSRSESVDFIIVAFRNEPAEIESLASSLSKNTRGGRIILVANDDGDYVVPSGSTIIEANGNVGFAAGVKLGVLASDARYVVVVNPDCLITDDALARFVNRLRPGCGVLVPKLLTDRGTFDYYPYENWTFSLGRKIAEARCRRRLSSQVDESLPPFAKIPGALIGLERTVAIDLDSPFDSAFFLYAEDRDLTDRVRRRDVPIRFLPDVEITHIGGQSGTSVSQLVEICKTDGSLRVASRRYGRFGAALFAVDTLAVGAIKRLLRRPVDIRSQQAAIRRWWRSRLVDPGPLTSGELQEMTSSLSHQDLNGVALHAPRGRVLVMWADNSAANLGLRVLAEGSAALLTRSSGETLEVDFQDFGPGDSLVSFGTRSILRDIGRRDGPIKTKLRQYDFILDTGAGDSFTDIYGLKRLSFIAYAHWMMRRLGIPLVLGPQTIGPFNTLIGRMIARRSLRQAALVMTRDAASATYAEDTLDRRVDLVGTDLVFMLPANDLADQSRDVILNVSGLLWFGDDHVDSDYYREQVRSFVETLETEGRTVSLLAHVVNSSQGNDDIDAINAAASLLGRTDIELLVPRDLKEARAYIASGTALVGARMHACLNALSQGVPAIPWAYSRKFEPLLTAVGWSHVLDLRDGQAIGRQSAEMILNPDSIALLAEQAVKVAAAADISVSACVEALSGWLPGQGAHEAKPSELAA